MIGRDNPMEELQALDDTTMAREVAGTKTGTIYYVNSSIVIRWGTSWNVATGHNLGNPLCEWRGV